jgi:A/G-specific adenine glycosylase
MELTDQAKEQFSETLWAYYAGHGRNELPWRLPDANGMFDPYKIMVSELMLQQTQVARVIPKYEAFLERFPDITVLAVAQLGDVLRMWQGLGYNRRAKFLWQAAQHVHALGAFPDTLTELIRLPGIGANTAGAILAYAYNQPVIFIETNIRSVYIHHFFADQFEVADKEITALVEQTLDSEHPREFYWALMDYGSHVKATIGNVNKASKHYAKQSKFEGSRRQLRGAIIRLLGTRPYGRNELLAALNDSRAVAVLDELSVEGMVAQDDGCYRL